MGKLKLVLIIATILAIVVLAGPFAVLFGAPAIPVLGVIGALLWATGAFKSKDENNSQ